MKPIVLTILFLFFSSSVLGQDFSPFQSILSKHLKDTELSGGGLQTAFDYNASYNDKTTAPALKKQTDLLKNFTPSKLKSKNEALAFWINAYNFFMAKVILEQGFKKGKLDVNSVKDFGSFFSPYKIFKKEIHIIGGKKYSLDGIEKETLLGSDFKAKKWKDARIHFAVNCASVGCPPLLKTIYTSKTLDKTLDDNIKKALLTPRHFLIKGKTLHLTHLFKWYKKDFKEHSDSVQSFLKKYITNPDTLKLLEATTDIKYIEYDWNLNQPKNF